MKHLVLVGRLILGAWMLINGVNHFFIPLYPEPVGHEALAVQLMSALVHSKLFDVAMAVQLVAGAVILSGFFLPVALCVVMPICTCAAFWAVILEHQPLGAVLALAAVALDGLLMLAYIDYYKGMLQRRALTLGEA
jgi:putative oxidoreductase